MSQHDTLNAIAELTDALYQAEQAKLQHLLTKEKKLRSALKTLEEKRQASLSLPAKELHSLQQVGADILWQGWISRNRAELNRQLAICLAQKAQLMSGLRRAFGKNLAAQNLLKEEETVLQLTKDREQLLKEQSLNVIRGRMGC